MALKTVAIVQARVASTRLPGKVLLDLHGYPLIWHVITRTQQTPGLDEVILATGDNPANRPLVDLAYKQGWPLFVGPEDDVLSRYYQCAQQHNAAVIVRITGDCPLISPQAIADVLEYRKAHGFAYACNCFPPMLPDGLDTEVFTMSALYQAHHSALRKSEREHVTPWMRAHIRPWGTLRYPVDHSGWRLTVDEPQDLALMRTLMELEGRAITWQRAVMLLKAHPELRKVNAGINRNEGYERSLQEEGERV